MTPRTGRPAGRGTSRGYPFTACDLPSEIGKTAARELAVHGITRLERVADHAKKELLAIHGVGPKAIAILGDALAANGLDFSES